MTSTLPVAANATLCGVANAGPPLEPDEPTSLDLYEFTMNGVTLTLTKAQEEHVEQQVMDELSDDSSDN